MKKISRMLFAIVLTSTIAFSECIDLPQSGEDAVSTLKNSTQNVAGIFVNTGTGAFDWIYIAVDGSYAAKLEGIDSSTNYFQWSFIYGVSDELDSVSLSSDLSSVTFGDATGSSTNAIIDTIKNKQYDVAGLFVNYGTGAFDWLYSALDGSYAAKLEGQDTSTGYFEWTFLNLGSDKSFNTMSISSDNKSIIFGDSNVCGDTTDSNTTIENPPETPDLNSTTSTTTLSGPPTVPSI